MNDKQKELSLLRKKHKSEQQDRIADKSRDRLKDLAAKKFKTCFIFALSEFETVFGLDLWGHGLPESELTSTQKANRKRWKQVRNSILDKGHMQARGLEAEIDLHEVKFKGYKIDLIGGNKDGD